MAKVEVRVPFAGEVTVYVEAAGLDREDLTAAAVLMAGMQVQVMVRDNNPDVEVGEWDCMEAICEGNVLHAVLERVEIDDDWEEGDEE